METVSWKWVWKVKAPQKVRSLLWFAFQNRLQTHVFRHRIGLSSSDRCSRCGDGAKTVVHVLRDCSWARAVWAAVLPESIRVSFFHGDIIQWVHTNLFDWAMPFLELDWYWKFVVGICVIWVR